MYYLINNNGGLERLMIGITARIGRTIEGVVEAMTRRVLLDSPQSLLIVGPPNVGKTTILREFARLLSHFEDDKPAQIVCVVDKVCIVF
jgi:stage III sporulation protein SpoIIIAA